MELMHWPQHDCDAHAVSPEGPDCYPMTQGGLRQSGLLEDRHQDRCQARLGPGARRNALFWAAHLLAGVALFRFADRRAP
jgi:hypothetical protein